MVPRDAAGLRARSVVLQHGQIMDWHSTQSREELLITLSGTVTVEVQSAPRRICRLPLGAGRCLFLPTQTRHRLVNRSRTTAHYLYVTAPVR